MAERTLSLPAPPAPSGPPPARRSEPVPLHRVAPDANALREAAPQPRIAVVGVGGGGTNALNHLGHIHGDAVRRIALNTDAQTLALCQADDQLCLGAAITQGLGTGGQPEVGERAAEASRHHIAGLLRGMDLVFLAAGLGGGTGTGAAPVVARLAREQGALTVGMVSLPFGFEGARRRQIALAGLDRLGGAVDALIVLPNDRLLSTAGQGQSLQDTFVLADEALRRGIVGIVEIATTPGLINLDFADVRAVLRGAGRSVLALGEASGHDRAAAAVADALTGGWQDADLRGAERVLINLTASPDVTLFEVTTVVAQIGARAASHAELLFGLVSDPALADTLRITLLAASRPAPR